MVEIKEEIKKWAILFCVIVLVTFIVFYKASLKYKLLTPLSTFYIFILPGIPFSYMLFKDKDFIRTISFSFVFGTGIIGILSYHLSLIGLNVRYHHLYLPALIFVIGLLLMHIISKNNKKVSHESS